VAGFDRSLGDTETGIATDGETPVADRAAP
jgi:hypothetical protein